MKLEFENPVELAALRMAVLSGKFPFSEREWRIIGNPVLARVCSDLFSIPLRGEIWRMDVEANAQVYDSVKRDVELAAINSYWDTPSSDELDVLITNLIAPFSATPTTVGDLKQLYLSLSAGSAPEIIENSITSGAHLFFANSEFDPINQQFRFALTKLLGNNDICCTVKFQNVTRFNISSQTRPEEMGFDEITRTLTGYGHKYSFWTPGGFVEFHADLDIEIDRLDA